MNITREKFLNGIPGLHTSFRRNPVQPAATGMHPLIKSSTGSIHLLRRPSGTWVLDDLLDHLFNFVPIRNVNWSKIDLEVIGNVTQSNPTLSIMHKAQGDTNTAKSTGAPNSVQISLWVRSTLPVSGNVLENTLANYDKLE